MDKYLRPTRFDCDPNTARVDKQWKHWLKTFENFLVTINSHKLNHTPDKVVTLTIYIASNVYIADEEAIEHANDCMSSQPTKEIYSRHLLASRKQEESESLDQYMQVLRRLSKDCSFTAVTALENEQSYIRDAFVNGIRSQEIRQHLLENEQSYIRDAFVNGIRSQEIRQHLLENEQSYIRDAFVNGIRSQEIRQHLLENKTLTLDQAFEQAHTLEMVQKYSATYSKPDFHTAATGTWQDENTAPANNLTAATTHVRSFFCGLRKKSKEGVSSQR